MTTEKLLEKLRRQRDLVDMAIHLIESELRIAKSEEIVETSKKVRKWTKAQHVKFRATMKAKTARRI
jgi:hypothetical protein